MRVKQKIQPKNIFISQQLHTIMNKMIDLYIFKEENKNITLKGINTSRPKFEFYSAFLKEMLRTWDQPIKCPEIA